MSLLASASASALLVATPVLAQPADQPPAPPVDQNAPPATTIATPPPATSVAGEGDTAVTRNPNEIVVTGTRIRSPEFTSPDPVSRIDPTTAQREGKLSLGETLQSSPIAAGSTQITAAISSNFVTNGGPGAQTIDLRGLGANRTLVLLNGRRAGPAGTRGGVSSFDLNVLPQAIVKQVDILKTGASSIYGSDAVAGVVNLITKTDFNGFQIDAFGNIPINGSYGGKQTNYGTTYNPHGRYSAGAQYDISLLWGKTFDRGHVMVALDYFKQNELARGDRKYLNCPEAYVFNHNGGGRADVIDPRTGKFHCEDLPVGQVWTYDFEYNYFNGLPGNLNIPGIPKANIGGVNLVQYFPSNPFGLPNFSGCGVISCFGAPPGWLPTGYDPLSRGVQDDFNPFASEQTIIPKTSRYTVYADASYELTDNIELYGEFLANRRKTYQNGWRQFWTFGYTSSGSYCAFFSCPDPSDPTGETYLPPAPGQGGSIWANGWTGLNLLSPTAVTNRGSDSSQKVDYWRGVGGIRGDFGGFLKGWSYDAYVQYSHNKGTYRSEQILQDVYDLQAFQSASCVGTVLPVSHKQCIDPPWTDPNFLFGHFTPEQADFLFDWEQGKTIYKQVSGEASINGTLAQMPAGPVGVALGVTVRRDSINDTPGEITLAGNAWGSSAGGVTAGHSLTKEAFGEIQIPLAKDRPGLQDRPLSGAVRFTNVENVRASDGLTDKDNGNFTYKLGANWAFTDWLRFRGTDATSFRAPALFEEFKADETSFVSARTNDPCVQLAFNLAQGNISQRIFDNCRYRASGSPMAAAASPRRPIPRAASDLLDPGNVGRENGQRHPDATLRFSAEDAPEPCDRLFQY